MNKRIKWTEAMLINLAKQFETKAEMRVSNYPAIKAIRRRGLEDVCFAHMIELRKVKYSDDELLTEALKYNNRRDFRVNSIKQYTTIMKRGNYDKYFAHMTRLIKRWTPELAFEAAKQYTTRSDFARGVDAGAYNYALKTGILEDICGHMVRDVRVSNVVYIWKVICEFWNDKQVYKIGVTGSQNGTRRIVDCANVHNVDYEVMFYREFDEPKIFEKELLDKFEVVKGFSGDGGTEFRAISDPELNDLLRTFV